MFEQSLKCRCNISPTSGFFIPESKPQFDPDRLVDVDHIKLEITVDLQKKLLSGVCTTDFHAVAPTVSRLTFDAVDLRVKEVLDSTGTALRFDQDDKKLTVYLRKILQPGERGQVAMKYSVQEPRAGLHFIHPDDDYPNRPWQLWTQGQDQDNRYWIPCHDAPNEKATTEMIVTVGEKYHAISNGKFLGVKENKTEKTKTYHWKQAIPHASYLITLCVGEFSEIKESWKNSRGDEIPVQYFIPTGREREAKTAFGKTPKMIEFFSKKIGLDYPYEKYAQVVAWDFIYGGMENTTATTQTEYTLHPETIEQDYSSEPLVAHELAHQWFGDLLTCKGWPHAWLNEGFATYFESLWTEFEHGNDEFLYEVYTNEKNYKDEDGGSYRRPIVTNRYMSPTDIFDRHLYEKGGRVLHMLRRQVGEDLWWKAIHLYVTTNYAKTVETIDLQRAFEEVSGLSLGWFFEQWIFKAGHPSIKASYEWVDDKKQARFTISQTQAREPEVALFRLPLQIKIVTADGEITHDVFFEKEEETLTFSCSEKPKFVALNPENTVLGDWKFEPGRECLINQLKLDQDIMGRIAAAKGLSKDHSREAVNALGEALAKEKFWGVQSEIVAALGSIGSDHALEFLKENVGRLEHAKARKSAVRALGRYRNPRLAETFERFLKTDASPLVQYEAGWALGLTRATNAFDVLSNHLGKRDSWHDYYDRGILQGLAELKSEERVFPIILKHTRPGLSMFLRREAVDALARHSAARPTAVLDELVHLTRDKNFFVRLSAIGALTGLGDSAAAGALHRVSEVMVEPRTKRTALVSAKILREGKTKNEEIEKMKTDFDLLRSQYTALLSRLEKLERIEKPTTT